MSGYRGYQDELYAFSSDDEAYHDNTHSNKKIRSKTAHNRSSSRKANNSTVSLLDFDRDYVPSPSHKYSEGPVRLECSDPNSSGTFRKCVHWVENAGVLKVAVLGLVLGLLCAVLYQSVLHLGSLRRGRDNHLPCPSDDLCIDSADLPSSLSVAVTIRDTLHKLAGQQNCGEDSGGVQLSVLTQQFEEELPSNVLKNALHLVLNNPHWAVRWLDKEGNSRTRWSFPEPSDLLESTHPRIIWRCYLSRALSSLWSRLRVLVLVVIGALLVAAVFGWWWVTREQERKAVYLMVDRVLDMLKKHYINCSRDNELIPYLAIIHVRDTLIPPSERKRAERIWQKACEWIAKNESRVRVENHRIAGEDFLVWRWIQKDPPKTEEPTVAPAETTSSDGVGRSKEWSPWTAIDHYGPRVGEKVAPPVGTPSPYIRLKNMFDIVRMDDEQAKQIENSVLSRCKPHGSVVHIYVDRKSTFGCVYLKMESLGSANKAYRALHGGWYNGKLVTAKYIEESRYLKWFPNAANAKQPLVPS